MEKWGHDETTQNFNLNGRFGNERTGEILDRCRSILGGLRLQRARARAVSAVSKISSLSP